MENFISLAGFFCFVAIAWCLSKDRKNIILRPVIAGIILQFIFGIIVFTIPASRTFFVMFSDAFLKLIEYSKEGISFVFGSLSAADAQSGFILAFQILPFIVIFASIASVFYFFGIMQFIIRIFAILFSKTLKTSGAETLYASANIFVGIESALTIKPYLKKMTESELFLILTAGMSTIASSVLAIYVVLERKRDFSSSSRT